MPCYCCDWLVGLLYDYALLCWVLFGVGIGCLGGFNKGLIWGMVGNLVV